MNGHATRIRIRRPQARPDPDVPSPSGVRPPPDQPAGERTQQATDATRSPTTSNPLTSLLLAYPRLNLKGEPMTTSSLKVISRSALCLAIVLGFFASDVRAALITPTGVTASSNLAGSFRFPAYLIDDSGLDVNDLTGVHSGQLVNTEMWLTDTADADPEVAFDLGSVHIITDVHIWNYNEFDLANFDVRGVDGVDIYGSTTSITGPWALMGSGSINVGIATSDIGEPVQNFALTGNVRYIRFDIASSHSGGTYDPDLGGAGNSGDFVGLSAVKFSAAIIPEPSSFSLLAAAMGLLSLRMSRRRRRQA